MSRMQARKHCSKKTRRNKHHCSNSGSTEEEVSTPMECSAPSIELIVKAYCSHFAIRAEMSVGGNA